MSRLKQAGLELDVDTANVEVLRWLRDVANAREHGTMGAVPAERWREEQAKLLAFNMQSNVVVLRQPRSALPPTRTFPKENLQHPLSVYEAVLS